MFYKNKDYKKTIAYCKDLLKKETLEDDIRKQTLYLLGLANLKIGNFNETKFVSEKLIEIDPALGHFLRGLFYLKVGNKEEGVVELNLALKFDENTKSLGEAKSEVVNILEQLK